MQLFAVSPVERHAHSIYSTPKRRCNVAFSMPCWLCTNKCMLAYAHHCTKEAILHPFQNASHMEQVCSFLIRCVLAAKLRQTDRGSRDLQFLLQHWCNCAAAAAGIFFPCSFPLQVNAQGGCSSCPTLVKTLLSRVQTDPK